MGGRGGWRDVGGWGGILTAILVSDCGGTSYFFCQRGSDDSRWQLASAITSVASLSLRDSINDSELVRQDVLSGKLEKKVNSKNQEAMKGASFSRGLKQKQRVVSNVWKGGCFLGASARSYLLLSLVQQTDYVTDYDSEYDSCSSRPFVCLSRWLAAC